MTQAAYDEIADWYNESVQTDALLHYLNLILPYVFALVGDVQGKSVCDLACGQGVLSRQLARKGAQVVGVDLSTRMLEIARHSEEAEPLGVIYLQNDAQLLTALTNTNFDGVLCNLALMDIQDVNATFRSVQRVLRPGGWFVFSVVHPCFLPPHSRWVNAADGTVSREVRGYFEEIFWRSDNSNGVRGKVGAYHHMLSTYINALVDAGLTLERLVEPRGEGEIAERVPGYREIPVVLIARCRRVS